MGSVFKYIAVQKLTSPTSVISNKVIVPAFREINICPLPIPRPFVTKERNKVSLCFRVSLCCQYLTLVCRGNISLGLSFLSKLCKLFFNFKEAKIVDEKKYINNSREVLIYIHLQDETGKKSQKSRTKHRGDGKYLYSNVEAETVSDSPSLWLAWCYHFPSWFAGLT